MTRQIDQALTPIPPGGRLLHVGPSKTGTTSLQAALHQARSRLAGLGVHYAGDEQQAMLPALAVTGASGPPGVRPQPVRVWQQLLDEVGRAGSDRVVVSSEFFAAATPEVAGRVVRDLGGEVTVLVTLRPLARILPSTWQQAVQRGVRTGYEPWLRKVFGDGPGAGTPGFWHRQHHPRLLRRWAGVVGPERVVAAVADPADPGFLAACVEALVGVPAGTLPAPTHAANRSLTWQETELVRRLNRQARQQEWPEHLQRRIIRQAVVPYLQSGEAAGSPILTPHWALERAVGIGAETVRTAGELGVRLVGDGGSLTAVPTAADPAADPAVPSLPVDVVAGVVLAALQTGGVGGAGGSAVDALLTRHGHRLPQSKLVRRIGRGLRDRSGD